MDEKRVNNNKKLLLLSLFLNYVTDTLIAIFDEWAKQDVGNYYIP
jgi:hypothetical protein